MTQHDNHVKDYFQERRDKVVAEIADWLEKDPGKWAQGFSGGNLVMPFNPTTGNAYHGGNAMWLMFLAQKNGWTDPRFCGFNQAKAKGWHVKKGEKATVIEFRKPPEKIPKKNDNDPNEEQRWKKAVYTTHLVWNASQIEGIPPYEPTKRSEWDLIDAGERLITGMGIPIVFGQPPNYSRLTDTVGMPFKEQYPTPGAFYGDLAHEFGHGTGHPSRLNRHTPDMVFGSPSYAEEEMRVELASVFYAAATGIPYDSKLSAAYIKSWAQLLRGNPNAFFNACRDGQAICDYMIGKAQAVTVAAPKRIGQDRDVAARECIGKWTAAERAAKTTTGRAL
jgi:antirestriction protein ArdC